MIPRLPTLLSALAPLVLAGTAAAQSLSLKTAPIATGDQFFLLPSRGAGMGGLSVALRDTLGDPWSNPSTGARMRGITLLAVPGGYTISDDIGSGFTFALGGAGRSGDWFGGIAVALQQLQNPNRNRLGPWWPDDDRFIEDALGNDYAQVFAGRRIGRRTSLGISYFHAGLSGVEGVSQLYSNNAGIRQDGDLDDWRIGLTQQFGNGAQLEAVALHRRLNMRHDVGVVDFILADAMGPPVLQLAVEENLDRTRTTGVHIAYETPLADEEGVTLGFALTANRKTHPKIPNYVIANIPRDPGNSTALAATAGITRTVGPGTVGMELSWLPARSHTWAQADGPIAIPDGGTIPAGGRTVENWFDFSDLRVAGGYEHDAGRAFAYRFGIDLYMHRYDLEQKRYIEGTTRNTSESWFEWTPAWAVAVRPAGMTLTYTGRLHMKGFPQLFGQTVEDVIVLVPEADIDFLPAPSGPVQLDDFAQWTHQVAVQITLGGRRGR